MEQTNRNLQAVNQMIAKKYEDQQMHAEQDAREANGGLGYSGEQLEKMK